MIKRNDTANWWGEQFLSREKRFQHIQKVFSTDNDKKHHKVRDRCRYTGKCRGAAHSICNLRYNTPK